MTKAPDRVKGRTVFDLALGNGTFLTSSLTPRPGDYVPDPVVNALRRLFAGKHDGFTVNANFRNLQLAYDPPKGSSAVDLEIDYAFRNEAAVFALADLAKFVRGVKPESIPRKFKSYKRTYDTIRALGIKGRITAGELDTDRGYAIIEGDPAERLIKESRVKLKDPRLVTLKLDQYARSPSGFFARSGGRRFVFNFYVYTTYDAIQFLATLIDGGKLDQFFIERGVSTSAGLVKTLAISALGWGAGSIAATTALSTGGVFVLTTAITTGAGALYSFVDDEFGYTDLAKQKLEDMLEEIRQNRIRPGNVIRLS